MDDVLEPMRTICVALPEVEEKPMSNGYRWAVRKRTFSYLVEVNGPDGDVVVTVFRSQPPELAALQNAGHPFFAWGTNWVGMVLDAATDWTEVGELVADSYCIAAPKKLAAQVYAAR
jgi:hypothetical protein